MIDGLPATRRSAADLVRRLRYAVPQWHGELKSALARARQRLSHARVDGVDWYWPAEEDAAGATPPDTVRLLTPFDPVVWDRDRFELMFAGNDITGACQQAQAQIAHYQDPWWDRALIACQALAGNATEIAFAFDRAVQNGIADDDRLFRHDLQPACQ